LKVRGLFAIQEDLQNRSFDIQGFKDSKIQGFKACRPLAGFHRHGQKIILNVAVLFISNVII